MTTTQVIMSYPWGESRKESYVCTLASAVLEVAEKELREDDNGRDQALNLFREWLRKNYDIRNCRTDNSFLLRFLRVKKFSVPMAQQMLIKYLNLRQTFPHFLTNLDFLSPSVKQVFDSGYLFASPIRDSHGRRVIIGIAKNLNPYKCTNVEMAKAHLIAFETLLEEEENQVMGVTYFGDLKGVTASHITLWTPNEFATFAKLGEQSIPMRHKAIHCINCPSPLRYVAEFARSRFSSKIKKRFFFHDSLADCHKHIDSKVLPKEYGGTIPMADMINMWKKEVSLKRERLMSLDKMQLVNAKGLLTQSELNNNAKNSMFLMEDLGGSFKKLEVD